MPHSHTPGELKVRRETPEMIYLESAGFPVATVCHDTRDTEEANANAQRLVECWNACKGIENPIEAIPALLAALERATGIIEDLEYPDDAPAKDFRDLIAKLKK